MIGFHELTTYWLRWHCHVKDIAGAPYKIKQKKTEAPTVSSRGQYNHDCLIVVDKMLYLLAFLYPQNNYRVGPSAVGGCNGRVSDS